MKIFIAVPTTGTVKTKTFFSIVRMLRERTFDYMIGTKESSILHYNREHLAKQAMENECSHILFIDSDMYFEADAVERLLARNKDIIGVPYNARKHPLITTIKIHAEDGIIEEYDGELLKCAAVGMGFMLIKTEVLKNMNQPWFFWETNDKGEVVMGEDSWFCRKARQAGYDIWCDMSIKIGHIGDYIY